MIPPAHQYDIFYASTDASNNPVPPGYYELIGTKAGIATPVGNVTGSNVWETVLFVDTTQNGKSIILRSPFLGSLSFLTDSSWGLGPTKLVLDSSNFVPVRRKEGSIGAATSLIGKLLFDCANIVFNDPTNYFCPTSYLKLRNGETASAPARCSLRLWKRVNPISITALRR